MPDFRQASPMGTHSKVLFYYFFFCYSLLLTENRKEKMNYGKNTNVSVFCKV